MDLKMIIGNKKMWFTSDQHFGSVRALELSRRPFSTVEEMDQVMIQNFNKVVSPEDVTIHIGDFGVYDRVKELNGEHVLIVGNYERDDIQKEGLSAVHQKVLKAGFLEMYPSQFLDIPSSSKEDEHCIVKLFLVHEPEKCLYDYDLRYSMNLFGHIHGRQKIKKYGIDVGVDAHFFYPIDCDTVNFYRNAILHHYDKNVFM